MHTRLVLFNKLLLVLSFTAFALGQEDFRCYECGYMQTHTGERVKIPSQVENVPFCGEDALNDTTGTPTRQALQGGCCFAFKMEYMDETTGEATFVSRFGTSDEPEQPWFDQTCGRTEPGYHCEHGHVSGNNYDDEATVCHCYDDLCNVEVPEISSLPEPTKSTTSQQNSSPSAKLSLSCPIILFTGIAILLFPLFRATHQH